MLLDPLLDQPVRDVQQADGEHPVLLPLEPHGVVAAVVVAPKRKRLDVPEATALEERHQVLPHRAHELFGGHGGKYGAANWLRP